MYTWVINVVNKCTGPMLFNGFFRTLQPKCSLPLCSTLFYCNSCCRFDVVLILTIILCLGSCKPWSLFNCLKNFGSVYPLYNS